MASLIPGFEYDIFISYRQKDNKYDGWVTQFVEHLKGELESTFKEDISVYFDINPHDGLLETHDVDASLKDKLKCLVFIPIISRTYCDPKSFAWEHEFKAFVEQASGDQFGLKIKLPNGNVAGRVLPIRIHDLDITDIKLCEDILGGVLRGVEFIYKEPGVNRSLTTDDDEKTNLNKTRYRNQINKVALAINEIIQGLKTEPEWVRLKEKIADEDHRQFEDIKEGAKKERKDKSDKSGRWKTISAASVAVILIIATIIFYPRIFKKDTLEKLRSSSERISIAVMPFQNMTNDTIWNVWQDGVQDMLINSFSNSEELRVRQAEYINGLVKNQGIINYASITPSIASKISRKLDANVFIYGNIKQAGSIIRLYAQLIDSKSREIFRSFQIEGENKEVSIFQMADSLSSDIKNFLIISTLKQVHLHDSPSFISTNSPEAFRYFLNGRDYFYKQEYNSARSMLFKAIELDSALFICYAYISVSYGNQGIYDQAKKWCLEAYKRRDQMPNMQKLVTSWQYSNNFETPHEEILYLKDILEIDDLSATSHFILGNVYVDLYQYDKAIPEYEYSLELYLKWDAKPRWIYSFTYLGEAYHKTGDYKKEKKLYARAEQNFRDDPALLFNQAVLALSEGNNTDADKFIEKYRSIGKDKLWSETRIAIGIANIFSNANIPEKAEEYYRQALSFEPENPNTLNNLAWFLIDKDRNISEGLELFEKARQLNLDEFNYVDGKGYGLLKQGKYKEALDFLEKAWELKPRYNHETYLHLEEARKAVAGKK